nr:hypothetical protein [Gemmatimonadaceae bacterium]
LRYASDDRARLALEFRRSARALPDVIVAGQETVAFERTIAAPDARYRFLPFARLAPTALEAGRGYALHLQLETGSVATDAVALPPLTVRTGADGRVIIY